MKTFDFVPGEATSAVLNAVADCSEDELTALLRTMCFQGDANDAEVEDQIEALVPAVIELRDRWGVDLNMKTLSEYGTVLGFGQLAEDLRLSELAGQRCKAIHTRLVVQGVKGLLGHR